MIVEVGGCTIVQGDCLETLRLLPDRSIQCCVTSPPYWGLRDYGKEGQLGLESTPDEYVAKMVAVFREVRRVLRDDGTLWLNLGDSYAANRTYQVHNTKGAAEHTYAPGSAVPDGLKPKDLVGIPWRVAFALQADGWYLRQDIIWAKPNPMPESVRDRCTKSHEYIFLLTKNERYYFDAEAIKEPMAAASYARLAQDIENQEGSHRVPGKTNGPMKAVAAKGNAKTFRGGGKYTRGQSFDNSTLVERESHGNAPNESGTRNKRSVWTVTTKPFKGAHFATFPPDLIEPCILAGTSEKGACPHCGAPWKRVVAKGAPDLEHQIACGGDASGNYDGESTKDYAAAGAQDASATKARILAGMVAKVTTGWVPSCKCPPHEPVPCFVLDPFGGAGTVGLMANKHGRKSLLLELNAEYCQITANRLTKAT